jgi:hypothetical protein
MIGGAGVVVDADNSSALVMLGKTICVDVRAGTGLDQELRAAG